MSLLVIRDLEEWPPDGWAKYYPVGAYELRGHRYANSASTLTRLSRAWTVSQSHEAFETFLKDTAAAILLAAPEQRSLAHWKSRKKSPPRFPSAATTGAVRAYVREAFGGVDDLLRRIRSAVPSIVVVEAKNNRLINLADWLRAATEVRHAATHSQMKLKPSRFDSLDPAVQRSLTRHFTVRTHRGDRELLLADKEAEDAVQRYAEYAHVITKHCSILVLGSYDDLVAGKRVRE